MEHLASALAIGLPALGAALGIGTIGKGWLDGISRNPEAAKGMFLPGILSLVLAEAVAIYGLVIAIMTLS